MKYTPIMNPYLTKTAAELVEIHCFEHGRINQEDKKTTQRLVKQELRRRFNTMLKLLDCPELADHPEQIYEKFTHEYNRK